MPRSPNYSDLFFLGYLYHVMSSLECYGVPRVKPKSEEWTALWILTQFKENFELLNIRNPAIISFVNKWIKRLQRNYRSKQAIHLNDAELMRNELVNLFGGLINETLRTTPLYTDIAMGLINPDLLRKGLKELIGSSTYDKLPEGVKCDLEDGIKAIRIGLWTPAVMVTLRAVEASLREYYTKILNKQPVDANGVFLSWKEMLKELSSKSKVKETLIGYFHFLRARRNEADHPGKRFEQDIAERTLIHALEALKTMYG